MGRHGNRIGLIAFHCPVVKDSLLRQTTLSDRRGTGASYSKAIPNPTVASSRL
jgi:hypothetical protein